MKVFISHQRSDKAEAKNIADYLQSCGIDVYFDKYDKELQQALLTGNPKGIVSAIKAGVKSSTHMLVLVSPHTLWSEWVPFEIGYGYDALFVFALTLKGIKTQDIPDYINVVPIIRDIYDIDKFAKEKGNKILMESRGITKEIAGYERPSSLWCHGQYNCIIVPRLVYNCSEELPGANYTVIAVEMRRPIDMSEYNRSCADEVDFTMAEQLHAAALQISKTCFDLKKLCVTFLGGSTGVPGQAHRREC